MNTSRKNFTPTSQVAFAYFLCAFAFSVSLAGCANKEAAERSTTSSSEGFVDDSITAFQNLGWLGAQSHPLNKQLSFPDPDDAEKSISPGGLVVTKVFDDSVLSNAGIQTGDVIVGVSEKWLPIKDDPTLDFIKQIEMNAAGDQDATQLRIFSKGSLRDISINKQIESLEPAIGNSVPRYETALIKGLKHLASRQNADGSFGSSDNVDQKLQTTCLAGLSLLSAPDRQFQSNVDKCLEYVGTELDKRTKQDDSKESPDKKPPASPGVVMMNISELDIAPLTAAYVAQLFAESDLQMIAPKWMPRIMGTIQAISKSQNESGAWTIESDESDEATENARATFVTNQVLLGMGMLERKGMSGNPEALQKACAFLKQATKARSGLSMDRRLKNTLTAGSAAALMSINCKATDAFLKQAVEDGLTRIGECHTSPELTLPGVLSTAILARQTSPEAWEQFHMETKYWLSSLQLPDGSFQATTADRSGQGIAENDPDMQSALYCLLLSMPSKSLPKLKAEAKSPMMVARNSDGEKVEGSQTAASQALPAGIPAGANVMSFSMDDLSGEGSLEDQIKEKLKSMGIEGDIQIGSGGSPPDDEDK